MKAKFKGLVFVLALQLIVMLIFAMFLMDSVERRADEFYQQGVKDAQENCLDYLFYSWNHSEVNQSVLTTSGSESVAGQR